MKCRNCHGVMTMAEWEEKRRCFCQSVNLVEAIASDNCQPVRFATTPINTTIFGNVTSRNPINNSNTRFVNQELINLFDNISFAIQSHKRDLVYSSIIVFLGVSLFNSCSQPSLQTKPKPDIINQSDVVNNPYRWQFPRSRCGDTNYSGLQNFYPVYVNRTDTTTLKYLKQNYCRDAYISIRKNSGKRSIQVASFSDRAKAFAFARIMLDDPKVKSGEVGEPNLR